MTPVEFQLQVFPRIEGRTVSFPRGYGHAKYKVLDAAKWRETKDALKLLLHWEHGVPVNDGNQVVDGQVSVALVRIGGYEGPVPESEAFEVVFGLGNGQLCAACLKIVDDVLLRRGRQAADSARAELELTCDRRCACGQRIRCDHTACSDCSRYGSDDGGRAA